LQVHDTSRLFFQCEAYLEVKRKLVHQLPCQYSAVRSHPRHYRFPDQAEVDSYHQVVYLADSMVRIIYMSW
jgi:hypothetical protein